MGPDQGLEGTALKDFSFGTDVADGAEAPIRLCPDGPLPAATLVGDEPALVPNLPLRFAPSAPVDESKLAMLKVTAGGKDVPVMVSLDRQLQPWGGQAVVVTPVVAFPPNTTISVQVGGLVDVLGRPFSVEKAPATLMTTATVTDLTFASAPPVGAMVASVGATGGPQVLDGALTIGGRNSESRVLLGLGDPGARNMVRVRAGVDCKLFGIESPLRSSAAVVGSQGEASVVNLACGPITDITVARPAAGALWLSIVLAPRRGHPQSLPLAEGNVIKIDEIAFE